MKNITPNQPLSLLDEQILRTLLYYDIFNYPLRAEEVVRFLGMRESESVVISRLLHLCNQKNIFQFGALFSLSNNDASAKRRLKGNAEAERLLALAKKRAKLIAMFPFVRAVMASGSLSKGFMDENSDLDFFIVTAPNRLWIARTLLVVYKRFFLFNSHKYFCVNYFVDEYHLEIEEKNLFTATELATVIPLWGAQHYTNLHKANGWLNNFFPNYKQRSLKHVPATSKSNFKRIVEDCINLLSVDSLEKYFRERTIARWKRLYEKNYAASDFKVAFKSKAYASKNHPRNYQRSVIEIYEDKLRSFGIVPPAKSGAVVLLGHETLVNLNSNS